MTEPVDPADMTWPSVTGEHVTTVTLFVPRRKWQQHLSWLVRKWRFPRQFSQTYQDDSRQTEFTVTYSADGYLEI